MTKLTKKDFVIIAEILRKHRASKELIKEMAEELSKTNQRFKKDKFIYAALC